MLEGESLNLLRKVIFSCGSMLTKKRWEESACGGGGGGGETKRSARYVLVVCFCVLSPPTPSST